MMLNTYCPKIILYLPLAESFMWHLDVKTFIMISAVKVKSTLTLKLVVIFPACVCHCIGESFSEDSFV